MTQTHRRRLSELIEGTEKGYSFFSRLIGRNAAYIHQYLTRGSPKTLSEGDALTLAHYFDVPLGEIFPLEEQRIDSPDLVFIPIMPGGDSERVPAEHWVCSRSWLSSISKLPQSVFGFVARGNAMAPTLADGDLLLCERHHNALTLRDGLYVLEIGNRLEARRLALEPRRKLVSICSDNDSYPNFGGISRGSLTIIGRVCAMIKRSP